MNFYRQNEFIFSPEYRFWRHLVFWTVITVLFSFLWTKLGQGFERNLFHSILWLPVRMLYCYPLMYWALPRFLLKEKFVKFCIIILLWALGGWFLNYLFRAYIFIPLQENLQFKNIVKDPWAQGSFLVMTTIAGITSMIVLFKYWVKKQQEWMQAENEKISAELQLLKAQVHPHFLFNTLNNIYSFSLENSPKTPGLILKLSSLLSYMLYECKTEEVRLEKEIEIMKSYLDLEKERYGNKIDISWSVEGNINDKYISPLLLLPFLENAFKHGTSEQLEKPWLSFDLTVWQNKMKCKIVNSKNEFVPSGTGGIGIGNVKKRLGLLYPGKHELRLNDEGNFFVVSLIIELKSVQIPDAVFPIPFVPAIQKI